MSTKIKFYTIASLLLLLGGSGYSQVATAELPTFSGTFAPGSGPSTAAQGPISLMRDNSNNNSFTNLTGANVANVKFTLANQQYNGGMPYSNIQTGLVFGALPTVATGGVTQQVDPSNIYTTLGDFIVSPGGPVDNMYTVSSGFPAGTGIVTGALFPPAGEPNGAVFVFTNAQWQFDRPGGPSLHNTATRYYYGDLVVDFNRYIQNPVIHIAGLGGSYRYLPSGQPPLPTNYLSTFFTTELEVVGKSLLKLSGNSFLDVSGSNITNNAAAPSGASVSTAGVTLFDELGAASGSIRVAGFQKQLIIRVYLRGSDASQFPWSAPGSASGGTRNPLTGDVWGISVSAEVQQLVTLPANGVNLKAVLNGNDVKLDWTTQSELDTKEFQIERSADGINYTQIGVKAAAGNSITATNYSDVDPNMNVNVYYYRLKMVDLNGSFTYSNVAIVKKAGSIKGVRVFPNPATNNFSLEFSNAKGDYYISVFSITGQEVLTRKVNIQQGVQFVPVERGSLNAGSYMVKVKNADGSEQYVQQVILQ
jgi:hypothetical protein